MADDLDDSLTDELLLETAEPALLCAGERIALVGKLAGMSRRDAQQLIREQGGTVAESPDETTTWIVVGEDELPLPGSALAAALDTTLDEPTRRALDAGELRLTGETQLWHHLGLVDAEQHIQRLYTPAMLADLLHVPVALIRRWHRRGLICPVREVRRLPYFDFTEVAAARRLAELLAGGITAAELEKRLAEWARYLPQVERPLAQLALISQGNKLLVRRGAGLLAPSGQMYFDFAEARGAALGQTESPAVEATETDADLSALDDSGNNERGNIEEGAIVSLAERRAGRELRVGDPQADDELPPEMMLEMAAELEDQGELSAAADLYRAVLAARGPLPEVCFVLAELLYRQGDLTAARERYAIAIELNEDYVEARANLGCVLAELGDRELAVAAFAGALKYHPDYADVHFHLARVLTDLNRIDDARPHWEAFLQLSPESPWCVEARRQLE